MRIGPSFRKLLTSLVPSHWGKLLLLGKTLQGCLPCPSAGIPVDHGGGPTAHALVAPRRRGLEEFPHEAARQPGHGFLIVDHETKEDADNPWYTLRTATEQQGQLPCIIVVGVCGSWNQSRSALSRHHLPKQQQKHGNHRAASTSCMLQLAAMCNSPAPSAAGSQNDRVPHPISIPYPYPYVSMVK